MDTGQAIRANMKREVTTEYIQNQNTNTESKDLSDCNARRDTLQ